MQIGRQSDFCVYSAKEIGNKKIRFSIKRRKGRKNFSLSRKSSYYGEIKKEEGKVDGSQNRYWQNQ